MATIKSILFAASEVTPYVKTGGLAEVITSLAVNLNKQGYKTSIILPRYQSIVDKFPQEKILSNIQVPISDRLVEADVYRTKLEPDIWVYFVDKPLYFDRKELYRTSQGDYQDNAERFIFFSRAVVEILPKLPESPNIIHCNDWHTGLVPLYIKHLRRTQSHLKSIRTLFTIHNISYQGLFWRFDMHLTGLPWSYFTSNGIEYYGDMNLLKSGIIYSDAVNTVSEQYCKEIQTPEYGCGLDGLMKAQKHKLYGILNAIDYDLWNPQSDPYIPKKYSIDNLDGKSSAKKKLLRKAKLTKNPEDPIMGMVTRLTSQKGLDILSQTMSEVMKLPVKLIILGTGDRHYEEEFIGFRKQYPDKYFFFNTFDDSLAHLIEAGSDIFLMPSRFEPCGLNQMYSLRYGTVPIVRATGGLSDSVDDISDHSASGTGFTFNEYSAEILYQTIQRALKVFQDEKQWKQIMMNGMRKRFSWTKTTQRYVDIYKKILSI